jgi:hypothetical protein
MASGLLTGGVDLDSRFMARVNAKRADVGFKVGGVDVSNRWETIGSGTPIAATGFKAAGTDLASLFRNISEPLGTSYALHATSYDTGFGSDGVGFSSIWAAGTLSPGAFKGQTITNMEDVLHNILGDPAFFQFVVVGAQVRGLFTSIVLNGRTFLSSSANFTAGGGGADSYWSWPATTAGLVNGGNYTPLIS